MIHNHLAPEKDKVLGPPLSGARDAICKLRNEDGHKIIIYSVKPPDIIEDWMRNFDIPFDRITTQKPEADLYLDDKALRFLNWELALASIEYHLPVGGSER